MNRPFFLVLLFISFTSLAQQEKLGNPISEITIEGLDLVSLDTRDQIFASSTSGDIYQFSEKGKQLNLFSPARQGRLQQLEASWTVNIFSFSEDLQEYRILDRFLKQLTENSFLQTDINLAKAATLGNNNIVWVWDESDLSLKILDYRRNLVIQSQPLNLILNLGQVEVLEIREFKNRLFMNVEGEGIFIFDNQGNFIEKISLITKQRMCFYKEHLLWVENTQLNAISISENQVSTLIDELPSTFEFLQIGQEKLVFKSKGKLTLYPIPSWLKSFPLNE